MTKETEKPKMKTLINRSIYVDPAVWKSFKTICCAQGRSITDVTEEILDAYIQKHKNFLGETKEA